jgi:hypothetical protein
MATEQPDFALVLTNEELALLELGRVLWKQGPRGMVLEISVEKPKKEPGKHGDQQRAA